MALTVNAKNITLAYDKGKKVVLKDVNLKIKKGEFVFITGPSGSGKSTLLKTLYGALKPTKGSIEIIGLNTKSISTSKLQELRKSLGIIFQDYKLINDWTVKKNIVLPLIIEGRPKTVQESQVEKLLKHVKLTDNGDNLPLELSGGEQQRVGVARALARNPVLILADEPTGNLDEYSSNMIWDLMESSCQQLDTTIIVVTHKIPTIFSLPYRHFIIESKGIYEVH